MNNDAGGAPLELGVRRLMPKRARIDWLLQWMLQNGPADILNDALVWKYIEATGARSAIQAFGAPKCKQLGRDLGTMAKIGYASRCPIGIGDGLCSQGFPRWVWSYKPNTHANILTPKVKTKPPAVAGRLE